MNNVTTLSDLERLIGNDPKLRDGLLIDMKGRLTVGELYADALFDHYKSESEVKKRLDMAVPDKTAIYNLNRLPKLTYSN
jgi:hypothetical protein